ncbi:hypothetical protein GCM10011411_25560 [Aurantiacibacter arachoides]|nr:hypothetical protein GCM10011411_25560 [Aurantiacibacter arachoides]
MPSNRPEMNDIGAMVPGMENPTNPAVSEAINAGSTNGPHGEAARLSNRGIGSQAAIVVSIASVSARNRGSVQSPAANPVDRLQARDEAWKAGRITGQRR